MLTKTADRNDLKLGTVVALDTVSKSIDFVFKFTVRVRVGVASIEATEAAASVDFHSS